MSYELVYDKRFIKLDDGRIIPMVLTGSSNCTQFVNGRERLERSWWPLFIGKDHAQFADTPDVIMAGVKAALPSIYNEWFKQGGKWVNDDVLVKFFQNGIKNAKTLEEYAADYYLKGGYSVSVKLHVVFRSKDDYFITSGYESWLASSNENLMIAINEAQSYTATCPADKSAETVMEYIQNEPMVRKVSKPRAKRDVTKEQDEWFVVESNDGNYLVRLSKYGYRYSGYSDGAKKFPTEKAANKWLQDNLGRISFNKAEWHIKKCCKYPHLVDGNYSELKTILDDNGLADANYLCRISKGQRSYQTMHGQPVSYEGNPEFETADKWLHGEITSKEFADVVADYSKNNPE